jgi:hypothetical protein
MALFTSTSIRADRRRKRGLLWLQPELTAFRDSPPRVSNLALSRDLPGCGGMKRRQNPRFPRILAKERAKESGLSSLSCDVNHGETHQGSAD